jgi:hypothetical protein
MPLLTWQLWLAKDVVTEIRLPLAKQARKFYNFGLEG